MEAISDSDFERLADAVAARLSSLGFALSSDSPNARVRTATAIDQLANAVARRFVELTEAPPAAGLTAAADGNQDRIADSVQDGKPTAADDLPVLAQRLLAELDPLSRQEIPIEKIEI
jgi:hypothetical protein